MDASMKVEALPPLRTRQSRRYLEVWVDAIAAALALPASEYPPVKIVQSGPPNPRNWANRNAQAWQRLEFAKTKISELAHDLGLPPENLISPDAIRRVMWEPPEDGDMALALSELKVRPWQQELVVPIFVAATAKAKELTG
jgi:ribonuclease D